jgi:DNA-directed RNA polymerase specialized sigma24 family protein
MNGVDSKPGVADRIRADADRLATTKIIGERQALAYALREIHGVGRREAADLMDTSASNVDNLLRAGRARIGGAEEIVAIVGNRTENSDV